MCVYMHMLENVGGESQRERETTMGVAEGNKGCTGVKGENCVHVSMQGNA